MTLRAALFHVVHTLHIKLPSRHLPLNLAREAFWLLSAVGLLSLQSGSVNIVILKNDGAKYYKSLLFVLDVSSLQLISPNAKVQRIQPLAQINSNHGYINNRPLRFRR